VNAEVSSPESLAAKIRAIRRAEFDAEDMPAILDRLAKDAERVGAARRSRPARREAAIFGGLILSVL
jgi:hypothetical protein